MTKGQRLALVILMAVLTIMAVVSFSFARTSQALLVPQLYSDDTSLFLLNSWYAQYNDEYFDNKLPKAIIDLNLRNGHMAETSYPDFKTFHITFDPHYIAAHRTARFTLLHEMCHVRTWGDDDHGPRWRTCMLGIDQQGGFRNIIIDKYQEGPQ
jgi:hypothetical protein